MNNVNWFTKILRPFFGWIDSLIYHLVGWILEGIFNLSSLSVSVPFVQTIYKRIYLVLAIFMVFKLTFSFLNYLISPDTMADKERGVGKVISRTVVMLAILVFLPIIFFEPMITVDGENKTLLVATQDGVLNTLPKLILGINSEEEKTDLKSNAQKSGENMAVTMLASLYYDQDGDTIGSVKDFYDFGDDEGANTLMDEGENDKYKYTYMWPLTTIAGILLVIVLLGIAIDIAIRTFKLMILQVMAPIPVMSYIDPKSSKDGAFNSWLKSFISTYLDLFIKLGTVYLLLLLIGALFPSTGDGIFSNQISNISKDNFMAGAFIKVFLIIGLFKFAKDAPKFIKDAMGIKDNGGGGGFMGKALSGMAGAAAGFAGGLATGGLAGGLSGIATGYSSGLAGKSGQAFSQVRDEQAKLLGKTPGGMRGKLQNKAMQRSVMKHTGLNKDSLAAAKQDMIEKQNKANELLYQYQADPSSISYDDVTKAQKAAAKAQSNYNDANSLAGQIGLKPNFFQENKRHGAVYKAANRLVTKTGKTDNIANYTRDKNESKYAAATYTDVSGTNFTGYEAVEKSKSAAKAAKAAYDSAKAGGFGPISGSDRAADLDAARTGYKDARDEAKRVKKDGRV